MGVPLFRGLDIPDCYSVEWPVNTDKRGSLTKVFAHGDFSPMVPDGQIREIFYSTSSRGVLRGMHLQEPSLHQWKIVTIISGTVLDVLVDVRPSSDSFGQSVSLTLSEGSGLSVVVPPGVAHGFLVVTSTATTLYAVSSEYKPEKEIGIRFDSFGFAWPVENPTLSARDFDLPSLAVFADQKGSLGR